jgi:methylated-DNA-[protein]-cysteine S-methyltransferase
VLDDHEQHALLLGSVSIAQMISQSHTPGRMRVSTSMTATMIQPTFTVRELDTQVGRLALVGSTLGVRAILWPGDTASRAGLGDATFETGTSVVLDDAVVQLGEYFAGSRTTFDLPLDLRGTPFQVAAWEALAAIPYGETRTYSEQAARIGRANAARAVGAANGRNPISIVLPCHRVVGSDGSLTGFAGGLEAKAALLAFEASRVGHRGQITA